MILKALFIFLLIVLYKAGTNYIAYNKVISYKDDYLKWIKDEPNNIDINRQEIINLLKKANVKDARFPACQPIGYGYISNYQASVYQNFPSKHIQVASSMFFNFDEAIGVYKNRFKESFNPIYWIEQIIFMPKNLLIYLGVDMNTLTAKLCNVLLSFIWWCIVALFSIFGEGLYHYVVNTINLFL